MVEEKTIGVAPSIQVTIEVEPRDYLEVLRVMPEWLADDAKDKLVDDPRLAARLMVAANLLLELRVGCEIATAHPSRGDDACSVSGERGKRGRRERAGSAPKIKHSYGADGVCTLDHGAGVCGEKRKRAPRVSAVTSEGVVVDERTLVFPGLHEGVA